LYRRKNLIQAARHSIGNISIFFNGVSFFSLIDIHDSLRDALHDVKSQRNAFILAAQAGQALQASPLEKAGAALFAWTLSLSMHAPAR
jgi:hypothetical protein